MVAPQFSEELLEQVGLDNPKIHFEQIIETNFLCIGEVPWVFQPKIPGSFKQVWVSLTDILKLHSLDLINGIHEMVDDMGLIEYDHRFATILMNNIDIFLSHVTADPLNVCRTFSPPHLEESTQGVFISMDLTFPIQIVDIGVVGVAVLPADLIGANESDTPVVFQCYAVSIRGLCNSSDCIPRDVERPPPPDPRATI